MTVVVPDASVVLKWVLQRDDETDSATALRLLDEYLAERGLAGVDAMKIDVQGLEAQVLRGAAQTIARGVSWIWLEFSPDHLRGAGTDPEGFLESLGALGMQVLEVTEDGTLEPLVVARNAVVPPDVSESILSFLATATASGTAIAMCPKALPSS